MKTQPHLKFALLVFGAIASAILGSSASGQTLQPSAGASDEQTTGSASLSFKTGIFYSMRDILPPTPLNLFPDLPIYDLGEGKFMYDDREVDYEAYLKAARERTVAAMALAKEAIKNLDAGEKPEPLQLGTGVQREMTALTTEFLSVGIINDPPGGFILGVFNMTPGVLYGIGAKNSLDPDPFNTWTLVNVFEAAAPNEQFSGTISAPYRFYRAVNLEEYTGPSVSILSPAPGTTVSGDIQLQVQVTDILPLLSIKVFVGEVQVGVIQPGQNGTVIVPTSWFPNGEHEIWVAVVNEGAPVDTDGDSIPDRLAPFQSWGSVTLNFLNDVYMQNYSPLYSAAGSITFHYTVASPQDYTFEVFRLTGELLHTETGLSAGGTINPQWNFTDLLGQPVNDYGYIFSLTYSAHLGATSGKITTTSFVDHGVTVAKYVISYGTWRNSSLNDGLADMNLSVSIRVNMAALLDEEVIGPNRDDYNPIYADFHSDPFPLWPATQESDLQALKNALQDSSTGSWHFEGHSGPNDMIPGSGTDLTVQLRANEIASLLGSTYVPNTSSANYGRRLFSTMITGCFSTTGDWPIATGTPPGVQQVGNSQIKKSAFLGFSKLSTPGSTKYSWIRRIHQEWIDGNDYDTPLLTAMNRANTVYPTVQNWGPTILGYWNLEYNGNESW